MAASRQRGIFRSYGHQARAPFLLIGNRLCVDFANTVYPAAQAGGSLKSWGDLVEFLTAVGIVVATQREDLLELQTTAREAVAATFGTALELRDALRNILEAIAGRQKILPESVEPVNAILRWTEGYDQLVRSDAAEGRWRLKFVVREQRLEWLLAAIARSAADLIAEGPGAPVRKCAHPACVLYFYDISRTHRRKWCSMAICGNRSKAAAHAKRRRATLLRAKTRPR